MQWINYPHEEALTAVIMAGGKGQRLAPFTHELPKPMLPISDKPLLEIIIRQLKRFGIKQILISVNYKKQMIENYFNNGAEWGVKINYLYEDSLRGTAGCLSSLKKHPSTLIIFNGDILSKVALDQMLMFHYQEKSKLTIGVYRKQFAIPYGVVELKHFSVTDIIEKPVKSYSVNAGIYILEPELLEVIPDTGYFHMTDLVKQTLAIKKSIKAYHINQYWQDIGTPEDYQKAKTDYQTLDI